MSRLLHNMKEVIEVVSEMFVAFNEDGAFAAISQQAATCVILLLLTLTVASGTCRALTLSVIWTVYAWILVGFYWGRYCLLGFSSGPVPWIRAQIALCQLLILHARHKHDELKAWWFDLDKDQAVKGGLAHVDTGLAASLAKKGTSSGSSSMGTQQPIVKDLVLVGGGHAHVFVLKNFGMRPMPGVKLTLITKDVDTPYSGMLPGHIAGIYSRDECHIDLQRLVRFANARLIQAEVCGITEDNYVQLKGSRPAVKFDVLSIDIGSAPSMSADVRNRDPRSLHMPATSNAQDFSSLRVEQLKQELRRRGLTTSGRKQELVTRLEDAQRVVPGCAADVAVTPVKPIDRFSARWDAIIARVVIAAASRSCTHIVVVGGGAGGVELALSMQARLQDELVKAGYSRDGVAMTLLSRGGRVLGMHSTATSAVFAKILAERGVDVRLQHEVVRQESRTDGDTEGSSTQVLVCANGVRVPFDECIWCTNAGAQDWLRTATPLALDDSGFIRVRATLESVSTPGVFAAGDVAAMVEHPRPKAGVFAVRAGPPLAANLRRVLEGNYAALEEFVPQKTFLGIIGTGRTHSAVASKGALALEAAWVWDLKDWIDRKWMAGYSHDLPEMSPAVPLPPPVAVAAGPAALSVLAHASMRCGGCGAKVGATVLSNVMQRLRGRLFTRPEVLVGLDAPDDCALVATPASPDACSVHTVDFFRSFIDDPYLFGQIAANHALSDCHAMCAEAKTALAICVVPYAVEEKVEETLFQMMAGACDMLAESECALVGGHTCEGSELALGFCVNGEVDRSVALRKGGMQPGDVVILTKPIGTGTIFAAEMRQKAKAMWIKEALEMMTQSNRQAAFCLRDHDATACTDVTGFGIIGHLAEMIKACEGVAVTLDMGSVPELTGARDCVAGGIFSSLQPANLRLKHAVANEADAVLYPGYPLLYDPQTAGGPSVSPLSGLSYGYAYLSSCCLYTLLSVDWLSLFPGLLATVPPERAPKCLQALRNIGFSRAAVIGTVTRSSNPNDSRAASCVTCVV
eukprot:m.632291 g.632291  ORF g.632291 m.632291 type:complete len:1029 (+) comp22577_c0_seq16:102-3188(+)